MAIKSAVVGCGRMGAHTSKSTRQQSPLCWLPLSHAESITCHHAFDLISICDQDSALLRKTKKKYSIQNTFLEFDELIESNFDFLSIATRTPGRAEMISKAIDHNKKIIHTEKPLCNSVEELDHLTKILSPKDILVTYGAIRRHFTTYVEAKKIVDSNVFGPLQSINIHLGRGGLFWAHPHSIDIALFFRSPASNPVSVFANFEQIDREQEIIVNNPILLSGHILFDNGVIANISQQKDFSVVLSCEHGEVVVSQDGNGLHQRVSNQDDPYMQNLQDIPVSEEKYQGTYKALDLIYQGLHSQSYDALHDLKNDILINQKILFLMAQSGIEHKEISMYMDQENLKIQALTGGNPA